MTAGGSSTSSYDRRTASSFAAHPPSFVTKVVLAGLIVRMAWILIARVSPVSDYLWYFDRAAGLAAGSGYIAPNGLPTAYFPIGYPAFLAALFTGFGPSVLVAQVANAILSTFTIWIVYRLAEQMLATGQARTVRIARIAALLFAFSPSQVLYVALLSDSVLFQFLLCSGTLVLLQARMRWPRLAAGGAIFGLATLTRPYAMLLPGVVIAAAAISRRPGHRMRRLVIVYSVMAIVLCPWTARNMRRIGKLVPVSTNGGVNLLIGNGPGATGGFTEAPLEALKRADLSEGDADRRAWILGCHAILSDPLRFIGLAPRKLLHMFGDDSQALRWNLKGMGSAARGGRYSPWALAGMGLVQAYYSLIVLAAIAFLGVGVRRRLLRRKVSILGCLLFVTFAALAVVFFGEPRFHFPLVPFLCFYAACSWESARRHSWTGSPAS